MTALWRTLRHLRPERASIVCAYVCMLLLALSGAALAAMTGPALGFVFTGRLEGLLYAAAPAGAAAQARPLRLLWRLLPPSSVGHLQDLVGSQAVWLIPALLVAVAVLKGAAQTGQFYLLGRTSQRLLWRLRREAFAALMRQTPSYFARQRQGDLLSRLTHDANLVEQAVFYGLGSLCRDSLALVGLLLFCLLQDARLCAVIVVSLPLSAYPMARFGKRLQRAARGGQRAQGGLHGVCYEALAGVREVQSFGQEAHEEARLEQAAQRYLRHGLRSYLVRAVRTPTMEVLGMAALAALLGYLGQQVQREHLDAGHYISFFAAVVLMYDPLKKLGAVGDHLLAGNAAAARLEEIIAHPRAIEEAAEPLALSHIGTGVRLAGLRFRYGSERAAGPWVLAGVDLHLGVGEVVALVGRSGAGKSTLANLLLRFYDPQEGAILVDGVDLRRLRLRDWRAQLGVVSQDTFLFHASIAENIAYGRPGATLPQVRQAAEAAYAAPFIEALAEGYDTRIGERGVRLSGGQRQRLAMARAFLRDPPLLLLDEATSHLDAESERAVQAGLERLLRGRTALVIAHRLSTVQRAHRIAVLQGGRIVEQGSHAQLLGRAGLYARWCQLQRGENEKAAPARAPRAPAPPAAS